MKKRSLLRFMLVLVIPIAMTSCKKDPIDPVDLVPAMDGLYVYGTNTIAEKAVEPNARMAKAILNPDKTGGETTLDGIYAKLMYIGAASTIQFTWVEDSVATVLGATDGGTVESGANLGFTDITADMIHGTLVADESAISITDEGLYYVFVNHNTMDFRIMKVAAEMIGDATEAQWSAGTPLPQAYVSTDSAVFEATGLPLVGSSGYKYRFSNGWEVYIDDEMATFTHLGVESYGTSWDLGINDIGYYTENIPHKDNGVYTVKLKYTASTGEWEETKTRTGNILIDYSATQMGLFGNAYLLAPGDTAAWASGEDGYELHAPQKNGNVYTWSWDAVNLILDREFIFLENGAWGGLQLDWAMLTSVGGQSVDDGKIVDATTLGGEYHNFHVVTAGSYNITLVIDAEADSKVVTITDAI